MRHALAERNRGLSNLGSLSSHELLRFLSAGPAPGNVNRGGEYSTS